METDFLTYCILHCLNNAAWWDLNNNLYGKVTQYAISHTEEEWKVFQRSRARLQHMCDYLVIA